MEATVHTGCRDLSFSLLEKTSSSLPLPSQGHVGPHFPQAYQMQRECFPICARMVLLANARLFSPKCGFLSPDSAHRLCRPRE